MADNDNVFTGSESRLKKNDGRSRATRDETGDVLKRDLDDGYAFNEAEYQQMLKNFDWVQEALPSPPAIPGHRCVWLSTTHQRDTIHSRLRMGYELVKADEVPGFEHLKANSGQFEGCVNVNEMVLAKIPEPLYQMIMRYNHDDKPMQEEQMIRDNALAVTRDERGRKIAEVEDGYSSLGVRPGGSRVSF